SFVNFFAAVSAIRSFQLPPQLEMTSFSAAQPGTAQSVTASTADATRIRFMSNTPSLRPIPRASNLRAIGRRVTVALEPPPRGVPEFSLRTARRGTAFSRSVIAAPDTRVTVEPVSWIGSGAIRGNFSDDVDLHQVFGLGQPLNDEPGGHREHALQPFADD